MAQYVTGLLVRNEPGAAAPDSGVLVDRWLNIQTTAGSVIRVFDRTHLPDSGALLSDHAEIREGQTYTFLLLPLADNIENVVTATHPLEGPNVWQGTIDQALWVLPRQEYLAVDPQDIDTFQGILVTTPIGQIIIPHTMVGDEDNPTTLRQGEVLRWDNVRFDLLAIMKTTP